MGDGRWAIKIRSKGITILYLLPYTSISQTDFFDNLEFFGFLLVSLERYFAPCSASAFLPLQRFTSVQSSNLAWPSDSEDWPKRDTGRRHTSVHRQGTQEMLRFATRKRLFQLNEMGEK
jgi:hypothetical protein